MGYVHNTSHRYGKLDPKIKIVFIRYCDCSKDYVMYSEHRDGGDRLKESHVMLILWRVIFPKLEK